MILYLKLNFFLLNKTQKLKFLVDLKLIFLLLLKIYKYSHLSHLYALMTLRTLVSLRILEL